MEKETITVTYALPAGVSVKTLRLEVLPDAANNNRIGRSANGKFTLTPTFAINGGKLAFSYQQADRRTPAKYNNGYQSPLLEEAWQSAPAIF